MPAVCLRTKSGGGAVSNEKKLEQPFEQWEVDMAKKKARRLIGKYGFSEADRNDLEQELLLHVFYRRAIEKYSELETKQEETSRLLDNKIRKIKEYAKRDKRSVRMHLDSMADSSSDSEGEDERLLNVVSEKDAAKELLSVSSNDDRGLHNDIKSVMTKFTPFQRSICRQLMAGYALNEIAKKLRRDRTTVFRQIQAIRKVLEKEGF